MASLRNGELLHPLVAQIAELLDFPRRWCNTRRPPDGAQTKNRMPAASSGRFVLLYAIWSSMEIRSSDFAARNVAPYVRCIALSNHPSPPVKIAAISGFWLDSRSTNSAARPFAAPGTIFSQSDSNVANS